MVILNIQTLPDCWRLYYIVVLHRLLPATIFPQARTVLIERVIRLMIKITYRSVRAIKKIIYLLFDSLCDRDVISSNVTRHSRSPSLGACLREVFSSTYYNLYVLFCSVDMDVSVTEEHKKTPYDHLRFQIAIP